MQRDLNLDVDYGAPMIHPQSGKPIPPRLITHNFIVWCVRTVYQQGIAGDDLDLWGALQTKLENAAGDAINDTAIVTLSSEEQLFIIRTCLEKKVSFNVNEARFAVKFLDSMKVQLLP